MLFIMVFIFPKRQDNWFKKNFRNSEYLVAESWPTPHWIALLMLYRLMYNIRSHFNEPAKKSAFHLWGKLREGLNLVRMTAI